MSAYPVFDAVVKSILAIFPSMPRVDAETVANKYAKGGHRWFQKGARRELEGVVAAHIRHVHTEYDKLLEVIGYEAARAAVYDRCNEIHQGWRKRGK